MKQTTRTKATALSVDEVRAATAELRALRQRMTFILPLTETERQGHQAVRIGPKKLRMVENRMAAAQQHRELLPPAFDLKKFERDTALAVALAECVAAIDEIRDAVHDTFLAVGNRAVVGAATAYAHIQVALTTAGRLKRTVERITPTRTRSAGKGTTPPAPAPAPPAAPAAPKAPDATPGASAQGSGSNAVEPVPNPPTGPNQTDKAA